MNVTTTNTVASGVMVSKVERYVDGALYATSLASPWSFSWNTLDPALPAFDGSIDHEVSAQPVRVLAHALDRSS